MINILDPDKILTSYTGAKIKLLILTAHILFFYWIYLDFTITGFLIGFIGHLFLGIFGAGIGFHRYFSHKSFKTSRFFEVMLLILGSLAGLGSCISWVGIHRHHHVYSDTDLDIHSPNKIGILRTYLTLWGDIPNLSPMYIKDLLRDKLQLFFHKNYFKIILLYIFLLTTISIFANSWLPILSLWIFPCVLSFTVAGIVDSFCHKYGYTSYNVVGTSKNNLFINFITLGNGLHNNHHGEPGNWNYAGRGRWYEIDPTSWLIMLIKK